MESFSHRQARALVLVLGTSILLAVAASAHLRGADPVEVGAIILFVPVTLALVLGGPRWGAVAGVLAAVAYTVVRLRTLEGADIGEFTGSIVTRVLLFVSFGLFGGFAHRNLEAQLDKLERYDEVDDLTGVGNARSLLSLAEREVARAQRYQSTFSLGVIRLDASVLQGLSGRHADRLVRRLFTQVNRAVRTTDRVTRLATDDIEELSVILPETGPEGVRIFIDRARDGLARTLADIGIATDDRTLSGRVMTVPGDEEELHAHLAKVRAHSGALLAEG